METEKTTISDELVILDGKSFKNIIFDRCILVYTGGTKPLLKGCFFSGCTWQMEGPAYNTLHFIREMILTGDEVMRHWIIAGMLGIEWPAPGSQEAPNEAGE